jgi:hypothetical protein
MVESRVMVQEYVKVLELFEMAKKVAGLQMADYATHREGLVRVLTPHRWSTAPRSSACNTPQLPNAATVPGGSLGSPYGAVANPAGRR